MSAAEATALLGTEEEAPKKKTTTRKTTAKKKEKPVATFFYEYDANFMYKTLTQICDDTNPGLNRQTNEYKDGVAVVLDFAVEFLGMKKPVLYQNKVYRATNSNDYQNKAFSFVLHEEGYDAKKWAEDTQARMRSLRSISFGTYFHNCLHKMMKGNATQTPWSYMTGDSHLESSLDKNTWTNISARIFKDRYMTFNQYRDNLHSLKDLANREKLFGKSSFFNKTEENIYVINIEHITSGRPGRPSPNCFLTSIANWKTGCNERIDIVNPQTLDESAHQQYLRVCDRSGSFQYAQQYSSSSGEYMTMEYLRQEFHSSIKNQLKMYEYEGLLIEIEKARATRDAELKTWISENIPIDRYHVFEEEITKKPNDGSQMVGVIFWRPVTSRSTWYYLDGETFKTCSSRESRLLELQSKKECSVRLWNRCIRALTSWFLKHKSSRYTDLIKQAKKMRDELSAPKFKVQTFKDAGFVVDDRDERAIHLKFKMEGYHFLDKYFVPLEVNMEVKWNSIEKAIVGESWKCTSPTHGGSFHPHISSGKVCTGGFGGAIKEALRLNNAHEVIAVFVTFLNSYNKSGQFRPVHQDGTTSQADCEQATGTAIPYIITDERGFMKTVRKEEVQQYYHEVYAVNTVFANGTKPSDPRPVQEAAQASAREPESEVDTGSDILF